MADSKFKIWIEDHANLNGLKDLGAKIKDVIAKFNDLKDAGKKAADLFFLPLKKVAVPAIGAVTASLGLAVKAMKDWAGQQLGEQDVTSALVAMGQYTDQYKEKLIGLANTYQATTGIADDYWLKAIGQLTRFGMNSGNVDKVAEALKNLTGLMDGNIETATDAIAKALQGQFDVFSRFGIVVERSGDDLQDLNKLIDGINKKGTGLLEARAETLAGKFNLLKAQISDMSEAAGERLASALHIDTAIDRARGMFAKLMTSIQNGGLGDILEKAGEGLRKKVEAAVAWAEKIGQAIQTSGKPIDQVFGDALRSAAKIFMDTLAALIKASGEIWKVAGIAIFNVFKEEIVKLPGFGGYRRDTASANAMNLSDPAAADFLVKSGIISSDLAKNPNFEGAWPGRLSIAARSGELGKNREAELAVADAGRRIESAISTGLQQIKGAFDELVQKSKTIIEEAAGLQKEDGSASSGQSTITIHGSDGQEITMALEEYIQQLREQSEKQVEAADSGTETLKTSTEAMDAMKRTSEAARDANTKVQEALNLSVSVSTQTLQTARTAEGQLNMLIGTVSQLIARQAQTSFEVGRLSSQVRAMRS